MRVFEQLLHRHSDLLDRIEVIDLPRPDTDTASIMITRIVKTSVGCSMIAYAVTAQVDAMAALIADLTSNHRELTNGRTDN